MITKLITHRDIVWHDPTCFILPQLDDLGNGLNILVFICNFKKTEIHSYVYDYSDNFVDPVILLA